SRSPSRSRSLGRTRLYDERCFVAVCGRVAGDLERLGDRDPRDPDDLAVPEEKRDAVALFDGDLAIDEEILELLLAAETEGAETVALAAVADGEARGCAGRELEGLGCRVAGLPGCRVDCEPRIDLRDLDGFVGVDREFVVRGQLR